MTMLRGADVQCPACGGEVLERDAITPHIGRYGDVCEASGLPYADAMAIQIIRAEGGERLRLAAHP
ncbi:hypothetical protein ACW7N6_38060 [Streptomyces sp. UC1A3]